MEARASLASEARGWLQPQTLLARAKSNKKIIEGKQLQIEWCAVFEQKNCALSDFRRWLVCGCVSNKQQQFKHWLGMQRAIAAGVGKLAQLEPKGGCTHAILKHQPIPTIWKSVSRARANTHACATGCGGAAEVPITLNVGGHEATEIGF